MSLGFILVSAVLVVADLVICMIIAFVTKGNAKSTEDYFIGGKKTGVVLLTLTAWASFSGAGNFIGQAGRGALYGVYAYWQWLGEGFFGGVAVAILIAPYLAQFRYHSMPHFIASHLCGGDHYVRRVGGIAALMPNMFWPGAQIMGIAYVLEQVFGIDYRLAVLVCGIVLIVHTTTGGINAVIYCDALHGIIQMIFAALVIFFGLKMFNFDLSALHEKIVSIDPSRWDLFRDKPVVIATSFLTGLVGATSNPIFWNRAFAAKDVPTARKSYGITFFFNIFLVLLVILIGIATFTFNQEIGDQALVWAILNKMPAFVGVWLCVGVLAACMSCADTHLNCAAANLVSDIMDPEGNLPPEKGVKYAKIGTVVIGFISIICAMFADYIYDLGNLGYTICGGVLIPLFVVGVAMRRDKNALQSESKLKVRAAQIGITLGIVCAMVFEFIPPLKAALGGGTIPAIAATTLGTLIPNAILRETT